LPFFVYCKNHWNYGDLFYNKLIFNRLLNLFKNAAIYIQHTNMKDNNYSEEALQAYLDGQLSVEEMREMDSRLETDSQLRTQCNRLLRQKQGQQALYFQKALQVRQQMLDSATAQTTWNRFSNALKMSKGMGAMILIGSLVLGYTTFWFTSEAANDNAIQQKMTSILSPYLSPDALRNVIGDTVSSQPLQLALNAYRQQQFELALRHFDEYRRFNSKPDEEIQFYQAICHLKLAQPKQALSLLDEIQPGTDTLVVNSVYWHKSLAYLLQPDEQNVEKAKTLLQRISPQDEYYPLAIKLLGELEKFKK
jgi:hypothetical protein